MWFRSSTSALRPCLFAALPACFFSSKRVLQGYQCVDNSTLCHQRAAAAASIADAAATAAAAARLHATAGGTGDVEVAAFRQDRRDSWRFTKMHASYGRAMAAYTECMEHRRSLLDLLIPCFLLAMPAGVAAAHAGGAGPAAKVANIGRC